MKSTLSPPGFGGNVLRAQWEFSFIVCPKEIWPIYSPEWETKAQVNELTGWQGGSSFTPAGHY